MCDEKSNNYRKPRLGQGRDYQIAVNALEKVRESYKEQINGGKIEKEENKGVTFDAVFSCSLAGQRNKQHDWAKARLNN